MLKTLKPGGSNTKLDRTPGCSVKYDEQYVIWCLSIISDFFVTLDLKLIIPIVLFVGF